jgi:hypothetical protein
MFGQKPTAPILKKEAYKAFLSELLKQWCDGMLACQVTDSNTDDFGVLKCPACTVTHSRCMDAVYPFLKMAKMTGDKKYTTAAINVFNSAKNVSQPDGAWRVVPEPKSWTGITVFGATALAEALHYHKDLLDDSVRVNWNKRLESAAEFMYKTFTIDFTNINYPASATYAFHLIGEELNNEKYTIRSQLLASQVKDYFSKPHHLLIGEGKPSNIKSAKWLPAIDLGYNVEESLNGMVLYALQAKDTVLLNLVVKSLEGHLEFMLPDGAWDNSWGTRQFKWSYWGSRTCDGSQAAYSFTGGINPQLGLAAYQNTLLLARCTDKKTGLLFGGLHFAEHNVPPCIHHTFTHAKAIAYLLDNFETLPPISDKVELPRSKDYGVKFFPEIDTWLVSKGQWKGTVSSYDAIYTKDCMHATGGTLGILWHDAVGPIFTASMAKYRKVEEYNQQDNPHDTSFELSPRIESEIDGKLYTNTFDLAAKVAAENNKEQVELSVSTILKDDKYTPYAISELQHNITYIFKKEAVILNIKPNKTAVKAKLILPIISDNTEIYTQKTPQMIVINKKGGTVEVTSNMPMQIMPMTKKRVFNLVPGMEALPIYIDLPPKSTQTVSVILKVKKA